MKIKNVIRDTVTDEMIIACVFLVLMSIFILVLLLLSIKSSQMDASIIKSFCEAEIAVKVLYFVIFVLPVFSLFLLINQINARIYEKNMARNIENFIEYIDFSEDKITLSYLNPNSVKEVYYNEVDSMEFVINTYDSYSRYGTKSKIEGLDININFHNDSCSIYNSSVSSNKLFKMIYYSKYIKNFSYKFAGSGKKLNNTLGKAIDNYIRNNYKRTWWNLFI